MSISLNSVNSEVVRAHQRIDGIVTKKSGSYVEIGQLKICWGQGSVAGRSTTNVTFPIKFSSVCIPVVAGHTAYGSGPYCRGMGMNWFNTSGMQVANISEELVSYWTKFSYIAIGY